ncbi:hypothetical protein BC937DRAFT_90370 [Endogone sp. FLAS-F59071]|nr:hypothetical protein BC937DRAFT_90370 [Endogone sp. FLAS-F59071]|eukprot:RUS17143.1 hypothetical protein BC937DRAFT_90370 [Endogone sp. FLAS-F59071]
MAVACPYNSCQRSFLRFTPDYRYLEDVSRTADTLTRENFRADPYRIRTKRAHQKSKQLVRQAQRVGIRFMVMPSVMKRHRMSQTNWSLKWVDILLKG